jgi:hypothetical protein
MLENKAVVVKIIWPEERERKCYFRVNLILLERSMIEAVAATTNDAKIIQARKAFADEDFSGEEETGDVPAEVPTVMFALMAWLLICS